MTSPPLVILSGERIQSICDIWCGLPEDFNFNPLIRASPAKHFNLAFLISEWNNPRRIFCYGHRLPLFQEKQHLLQNPFVLVTHNSDENITERYIPLLENPKLIRIYSQNPCIRHPRLSMIPIGIANSMWPHGSADAVHAARTLEIPSERREPVYFFFSLGTNRVQRTACYNALVAKGLQFERRGLPYGEYLKRLSSFLFCICPEGNGIDSHRLWECYYCGVVPILKRCVFTSYLVESGLPCLLVDKWEDVEPASLTKELYHSFPIRDAVVRFHKFLDFE